MLRLLSLKPLWQLLNPRQELPTLHIRAKRNGYYNSLDDQSSGRGARKISKTYFRSLIILYQTAKRSFRRAKCSVEHMHVYLPLLIFALEATADLEPPTL